MKCKICGKEIEGYTNNAWPFIDGECCSECNDKIVLPLRLFLAGVIKNELLVIDAETNTISFEILKEKEILKQLQSIVKGYIELYPKSDDKFFYVVNEEGLIHGLTKNSVAKRIFNIDVVGNLVVCPKEYLN